MRPPELDRAFGREAFGANPANYHAARPSYPEATWAALRERAGLRPSLDVLEIGAGTGLATAPLLAHGIASLVAVEPDARLATFLGDTVADVRLSVLALPFEAVDLPLASCDLVVSATAFHWLDAGSALERVRGLLRPGGAVALWWNVFGDAGRPDPFHEATRSLFAGQRASPAAGAGNQTPHGLDAGARVRELVEAGFEADPPQLVPWTLTLDPAGVRALYATYSNVAALPPADRTNLLDAVESVAAQGFGGRVERNMTTAIYTARPGLGTWNGHGTTLSAG